MKKKYYVLIVSLILWMIWLSSYFMIRININGSSVVNINKGDSYTISNADAYFLNNKLSVKIIDDVDINKGGEYSVHYAARNQFGIVRKKRVKVIVKDNEKPTIKLIGSKVIVLKEKEKYTELGYRAVDTDDGDITKKVVTKSNLNKNKLGNYTIEYRVTDTSNNFISETRNIRVVPRTFKYKTEYDKYDNKINGWGHNNKKDGNRPISDVSSEILLKYDSYYIAKNNKTIYLTFDEGSSDTYLEEIIEELNKRKIKATLFLCNRYMIEHSKFIKEMVSNGHIIGNHTANHNVMPKYANKNDFNKFVKELEITSQTYKNITGKNMPYLYRQPAGEWSYRSLKIAKDLGYRTYFWSAAYLDYENNISKKEAYMKLMNLRHNGAIYLIHPKNKGNYLAIGDFIDSMIKLGYKFDTVDKII